MFKLGEVMLNNGNKECGFSDEIVAYIYDEIGQAERVKFESHLANCSVCTDEFAGISNARFSVFEWQKEDFSHVLTPQIVIPYAPRSSDIKAVGFLSGLRDLLTLSDWSPALAVAGAVVLCVGLGFIAMNYVGSNQQIASKFDVPPVTAPETLANDESPSIIQPVAPKPVGAVVSRMATNDGSTKEMHPIKTVEIPRQKLVKQMTANNAIDSVSVPRTRKAPVLSNYEDTDDKSLRLADLFDDGGV